MSNPTSNFGWQMPTNTDLVTNLPADFEVFGQAVDSDFADLKGGTSGQILSKNSNTDLDFAWITNDIGDITAVTAGTGLSGGGTSGAVTLAIDSTVTTLTGSQTLTNKTLTAPVINLSINAQTGTSYTLVASDSSKLVTLANAASITVTIPPSTYAVGEQINIAQTGAGQVSFAQGAGVTIVSTGATASAPKIAKQYAAATAICTASNTFLVVGALA
jgi:predicted secreted protein